MVFFFVKKIQVTNEKKVPDDLKAEYDELISLFKRFDANKDGKLSWEEVKGCFRRLHSRFPAYRAQRAFQMADKNGDGYIDTSNEELHKLATYALGCYGRDVKLRLIV